MTAIKSPDPKPIIVDRKALRGFNMLHKHLKLILARLMEDFHLNWLHNIQDIKKHRNLRHLSKRSKYSRGLKPETARTTGDRNLCHFSLIECIATDKVTNSQIAFSFVHGCPQNTDFPLCSKMPNQIKAFKPPTKNGHGAFLAGQMALFTSRGRLTSYCNRKYH